VLCVGETLEERSANRTDKVLRKQLESGLETIKAEDTRRLTIAYEPIWAIGTGRVATTEEAAAAHAFIRKWFGNKLGEESAQALRILYGGSVSGENAGALMALENVDGLLVGGASLKPDTFIPIIEFDGPR
jgi:triosephosphate isomerase